MRILAGATTFVRRMVDVLLLALIAVVLVAVGLGRGAALVGRQSIVVAGGSMAPSIPVGSAIVVAPVDPATLAVGDVVSMNIGGEHATFTHRVVAVIDRADGRWIRTKGDANGTPDPTLVPATDVIGRVELALPYVGYLLALLSLPAGVIFVLGLAATLLAIAWLLESLQPDRVVLATTGHERFDPGRGDHVVDRGEPIAAPRPGLHLPRSGLTSAFAAPARPSAASPAPRPSVREQIERSRRTRQRAAWWRLAQDERTGRD
jgi:signal peptidase